MQYSQQNKAISAQAEAQNANISEGYRAAQENSRAAESSAFEQRTDRARAAARQLAMARVAAAEGGGSLSSMAINITGAEAQDMSRIDASLSNTQSSLRGQMGALQNGATFQTSALRQQASNNTANLGMNLAQGAMQAGASAYGNYSNEGIAKNSRTNVPYLTANRG